MQETDFVILIIISNIPHFKQTHAQYTHLKELPMKFLTSHEIGSLGYAE